MTAPRGWGMMGKLELQMCQQQVQHPLEKWKRNERISLGATLQVLWEGMRPKAPCHLPGCQANQVLSAGVALGNLPFSHLQSPDKNNWLATAAR